MRTCDHMPHITKPELVIIYILFFCIFVSHKCAMFAALDSSLTLMLVSVKSEDIIE